MTFKKFGLIALLTAGAAFPLYSATVSADSQGEAMKKIEPLMKAMMADLLSIDGVADAEKKFLTSLKVDAKELTNAERVQLAEKMSGVFLELKEQLGPEEKDAKKGRAIMIGSLLTIIGQDGQESPAELAALEVYRSIFVPETSLDECRAIALKEVQKMQSKSKRAELVWNLKGIKTAQIAYESEFDVYVPASLYPPLGPELKTWDVEKSGGFKTINWFPDGQVRGSYMVERDGPTNFKAIGVIDADGDGVYATYVATKTENPNTPITPMDVY